MLYDKRGNKVVYHCAICHADMVEKHGPVAGCRQCDGHGTSHVHIRCPNCSPPGWWACVFTMKKGQA